MTNQKTYCPCGHEEDGDKHACVITQGRRDAEIGRLRAALALLTNGYKYSAEVCNIARAALTQSAVEPTPNATPGAALLAEDSHGQVASLQGSGGCSEQPQSPSDTLAQFLNNALPKWSPLWAEYRALVGHPPVAPQRGTLEPPGEKHGEGADTGVEVVPHGVIYDKLGWLCSQCGGWNHARDAHCTHTHPRLPEKSKGDST